MPKVTVNDVAALAGVHASTVSRALDSDKSSLVSDETRARVRAAADELGYRRDAIARGLRRGRTNTLGVVVADIGNPFIAPVLRGIENSLEGRGMMALVAETQDNHGRMNRVLDHMRSRRVDAIITTAARTGDERLINKVAQDVPVVLAVRDLAGSKLPAITHDDERGGRLAAEHLLELGHRRIAQLAGSRDISSFMGRYKGFRDGLRGSGAELIEPDDVGAHPIMAEGQRLTELLLDQHDEPPTAIFAHNDLMAIGALKALAAHGLSCPRDIAMVGYNDTIMMEFTAPAMTTVRLPAYGVGRMAADIAVMLMENSGEPVTRLALPPTLVARDSTLGWRART